ncbi:MAG: T9SS type A sorting domain-containing protein [Candidatus Stygibacter australis]|nr:T9SS type A sorting domain-containing protein [Candidatus Stygibacter australis]MDP8321493.1 T9SS type A sorting domain-containing protein [Candidatus Stygibacter australis]
MYKKYFVLLAIVILPLMIFGTDWYVDCTAQPNGNGSQQSPFQEIGDAIENPLINNNDIIIISEGVYSPIDIGDIGIKITAEQGETVTINGGRNRSCIRFTSACTTPTLINGITLTNGFENLYYGGGISCEYSRELTITYCSILNCGAQSGGGIAVYESILNCSHCIISNNETFFQNGGGIYASHSEVNLSSVKLSNNLASSNGGGLYIEQNSEDHNIVVTNTLINNNRVTGGNGGAIYIYSGTDENCSVDLNKCTIVDNYYDEYGFGGISTFVLPFCEVNLNIANSIIYNNTGSPQIIPGYNVTYCDVEGENLYTGTGNINDDPEFVDASNDDYSLEYNSPCIDTGVDSSTYDDPDGSRADMGYLYHEQDVYSWQYGPFERQYLWKSFPKLQIDPNQGGDVDVENSLQSWNPLQNELAITITFEFNELDYGEYDAGAETWDWDQSATISSIKGYKMEKDNATGSLLFSRGVICESDTYLNTHASLETWLGYFLEDSQLVLDAFPSSVLDDAVLVKTMDWTISRNTTNDRWSGATGSSYINYADCVVIKTVSAHNDFTWETPSRSGEAHYRPVAEHFSFDDDVDYFPIYAAFDVNDMPDEVAVYIDGVCHGAQVVEDTLCQICAHILEEDPGQEVEFALWYDGRSGVEFLNNYQVFNESKDKYESKKLVTGMPGIHYKVFLEGTNENIVTPQFNLNCYPNPFNPELTIYFNLRETQDVHLNIYNVRGQKVKTLVSELFRPDDYKIVWNGDDNSGNRVSSGVYYIRLQVGEDIVNRKVILMK